MGYGILLVNTVQAPKSTHTPYDSGYGYHAHNAPPPLGQARPRSEKSRQNNGSTPTLCLDKAMHARDTTTKHTQASNLTQHGTTHKQLSKYCLSLFTVRGIRCHGIEALSDLPPHLEQLDMLALRSWVLSRFRSRLRE